GEYSFVILDTLARCMVGADENSAKDAGIVVDAMTQLLASTPGGRGVILGVHHAGKYAKTAPNTTMTYSGSIRYQAPAVQSCRRTMTTGKCKPSAAQRCFHLHAE